MNAPFPFGFPPPTAFYLSLYVLTLVVHVVFMNYVLAGSAYLAADSLRPAERRSLTRAGSVAALLRDWMPFALSAAITAGVAPLLFLQILYQRSFYTANLLLFHRWMAIVPVLIAGFYALYLIKSDWLQRAGGVVRVAVSFTPLLCILFTAASWTENHLLGQRPDLWPSFYAAGQMVYRSVELLPRLAMWVLGSIPTAGLLLAWQRCGTGAPASDSSRGTGFPAGQPRVVATDLRPLAQAVVAGLLLSTAAAFAYGFTLDDAARRAVGTRFGAPWAALAAAGAVVQLGCWAGIARGGGATLRRMVVLSAATGATLLGMTVVRECVRLSHTDLAPLLPAHAAAARVAGWWLFVLFVLINGGLIAWVIRRVTRGAVDQRREG